MLYEDLVKCMDKFVLSSAKTLKVISTEGVASIIIQKNIANGKKNFTISVFVNQLLKEQVNRDESFVEYLNNSKDTGAGDAKNVFNWVRNNKQEITEPQEVYRIMKNYCRDVRSIQSRIYLMNLCQVPIKKAFRFSKVKDFLEFIGSTGPLSYLNRGGVLTEILRKNKAALYPLQRILTMFMYTNMESQDFIDSGQGFSIGNIEVCECDEQDNVLRVLRKKDTLLWDELLRENLKNNKLTVTSTARENIRELDDVQKKAIKYMKKYDNIVLENSIILLDINNALDGVQKNEIGASEDLEAAYKRLYENQKEWVVKDERIDEIWNEYYNGLDKDELKKIININRRSMKRQKNNAKKRENFTKTENLRQFATIIQTLMPTEIVEYSIPQDTTAVDIIDPQSGQNSIRQNLELSSQALIRDVRQGTFDTNTDVVASTALADPVQTSNSVAQFNVKDNEEIEDEVNNKNKKMKLLTEIRSLANTIILKQGNNQILKDMEDVWGNARTALVSTQDEQTQQKNPIFDILPDEYAIYTKIIKQWEDDDQVKQEIETLKSKIEEYENLDEEEGSSALVTQTNPTLLNSLWANAQNAFQAVISR